MTERKYFKPKSLTWWAAFIPLIAGGVKAVAVASPALTPIVAVIDAGSGDMTAAQLIAAGSFGIGLRGAL